MTSISARLEQFRALDLVEKYGTLAVPLAPHHHGRNRMLMQVEPRPWKREVGDAQLRPFAGGERHCFHKDRTPPDRRTPGFAGGCDLGNVDAPISSDHVGLLAEMNDLVHPPAVEGNRRPAAIGAHCATRLWQTRRRTPGACIRLKAGQQAVHSVHWARQGRDCPPWTAKTRNAIQIETCLGLTIRDRGLTQKPASPKTCMGCGPHGPRCVSRPAVCAFTRSAQICRRPFEPVRQLATVGERCRGGRDPQNHE
jgi:hypothetical protein